MHILLGGHKHLCRLENRTISRNALTVMTFATIEHESRQAHFCLMKWKKPGENQTLKNLGITGCRKNFANDVQRNDLGLRTNHMLDVTTSNTERTRSKFYDDALATRSKYSANFLFSGANQEAVTCFLKRFMFRAFQWSWHALSRWISSMPCYCRRSSWIHQKTTWSALRTWEIRRLWRDLQVSWNTAWAL